ncbi:LANO_0H02498g1_1 [Lachancea nothofagi CBS 11611]|uniref:LANO_0H02498g1_1 n=1 Tax=Lachancea nothofagi CBS 11611 TaxID=1266666 RepID=A0A1G4KKW9_9SACH|nr:LANO_0H02498g1_1 [Lachancea nothofagi CBS 11611]
MDMQIQVDSASSSAGAATVSYAFLGGSSGGLLSLDQSLMLSTTAYSSSFKYSKTPSRQDSASTTSPSVTGSTSSSTGSSQYSASIPSGDSSSSTSSSTSSSSAAGQQGAAAIPHRPNWKLGAAVMLMAACGIAA